MSDTFTHAHLTTDNIDSLTLTPLALSQSQLAQLPTDDPLIITLAENYHAHTVTDSTNWRIFGPDEDVPIEFQTTDGYLSDD